MKRKTLNIAHRVLQTGIFAIVAYAALKTEYDLLVNSMIPLLISFIPDYIDWRYSYSIGLILTLWISLAGFLHALGALILYDIYGWYDQVAHGVSGSVVAGIGYGVVKALDEYSQDVEFPGKFRFLFIIIVVMAFGVFWEILEFALAQIGKMLGEDPLLSQHGTDDIVHDLALNMAGGIIVGVWGTKYYGRLSGFLRRRGVEDKMK